MPSRVHPTQDGVCGYINKFNRTAERSAFMVYKDTDYIS